MTIQRTMIIRDADKPLASAIADMFAGSPQNMWNFPLSATGEEPPTHWLAAGIVPDGYAQMAPWQVWQQDQDGQWVMAESYPGQPEVAYAACQEPIPDTDPPQPRVPCTLEEIESLFASADMTAEDPWTAMARLGLKPAFPPPEPVTEPEPVGESDPAPQPEQTP